MTAHRKQQLVYLTADLLSALAAWILFLVFRWLVYEGRVLSVDTVLIPAFGFWTPLLLYPLACAVVYYLSGYYLRPFGKKLTGEFFTTLLSTLVIVLGAFFIIIIDDKVTDYHRYTTSLMVLMGLQFFLCYIPRLTITLLTRRKHPQPESVVISLPESAKEEELYARIREVFPSGKEILVVPRVYDILNGAARIGELEDESPMVRITAQRMADWEICVKRFSDVVVSALTMVLLAPLFLVIAVAVYASSKGPVIYSQERIGRFGRPFRIYKFRTMVSGAETETPLLATDDDPRVTRVGHVLRKYRLDELPQLWNVFIGDMSLVGPRPERAFFINKIQEQAPYYCLLYKIRPGLTSWGPIKVGYTDTMEKMIRRLNYDIAYMENQSLYLDLKILFFTIGVLLRGKGQ